ncbi:amino acid permease [Virgibacillus dakarensis]|uniref:Aromatic amino acid transporter n=1 Tax=Lentibacillus populi TaxID=1827502 RepID=A0A9W5TYP9_9BACI|nr:MULTISPECIES: aromatic amino acid transport family protein [Bacillaceae]MTW85175.1 amino acid permease [Virgibacillus dakarensis]GGB43776.1 aromatic amino acid transporter [Lentibacillus populi]
MAKADRQLTEKENSIGESSLKVENISFWDGVSIIVGSSIGAGILSLAFGARQAGFPVLVFWIIVAGIFTTISMLYLAETTLRTKKPLQLSGLAEKYIGNIGSWLMFASVFINSLGALIAYTTGSGDILATMLDVPNIVGSLLFFIPSLLVVWLGLKVTGVTEKVIVAAMTIMVLILILATLIGPGVKADHLSYMNIGFAIPIFSLTIFCFISQYTVPELARGYVQGDVKRLPRAIITGMIIIGILLILVPMSALGLSGPDNVTEIVTISWAQALGQWAFFIANIFTLCAFITSFWAIGESLLTNIVDKLRFPSEWDIKYRLISIAIVALPPFIIAYTDVIGFVDVLSFAGAFAGVIMGVLPIMMLNRARKYGDRDPEWTCGWISHPVIQALIMILFVGAAVYTFLEIFSILPSGW